jgi:hypothetical protein
MRTKRDSSPHIRSLIAYDTRISIFALSMVLSEAVVSFHFFSSNGPKVCSTELRDDLRAAKVAVGSASSDIVTCLYGLYPLHKSCQLMLVDG